MEVLIVGAGEIGRWVAENIDAPVAFADTNPDAATSAADALHGRTVNPKTTEEFNTVLIAVPMGETASAIETYAKNATDSILDFAGVMTGPVEAMQSHAPELERASLHPLFAPDNAPGRIAIVTDQAGPTIRWIRTELAAAGNEFLETTPVEHDRAMETVQARAHAAVLSFALAAETVPEGFGTPVYDALSSVCEEVTEGTPRVYADIQATFDGAEDVANAATRLAAADEATFVELFREASERHNE